MFSNFAHEGPICKLIWSCDLKNLASGGDDNKVQIWNLSKNNPLVELKGHKAAVRAISWSPNERLILLTGGGAKDGHLKLCNLISENQMVRDKKFNSQICDAIFSDENGEYFLDSDYNSKGKSIVSIFESETWKIKTQICSNERILSLIFHKQKCILHLFGGRRKGVFLAFP